MNTEQFEILPKRWVVERTFGWLNWFRWLSKDYERWTEMSESAIYAAMTRILLHGFAAVFSFCSVGAGIVAISTSLAGCTIDIGTTTLVGGSST